MHCKRDLVEIRKLLELLRLVKLTRNCIGEACENTNAMQMEMEMEMDKMCSLKTLCFCFVCCSIP